MDDLSDFFTASAPPMRDVMIDIETMSTRPNAAFMSIGAITFDMVNLRKGERFYTTISLSSCEAANLVIDASAVQWWGKQSERARQEVFGGPQLPLHDALTRFADWIGRNMTEQNSRCVWGNGANFDPVIVESAYRATGIALPWEFWGVRCFRTLKSLWPNIEPPPRAGVHHHALDDAEYQVEHLFKIRSTLRGNHS